MRRYNYMNIYITTLVIVIWHICIICSIIVLGSKDKSKQNDLNLLSSEHALMSSEMIVDNRYLILDLIKKVNELET